MESEDKDNNVKPVPLEVYPHEKSNLHLIEDNLYLGNYISTKSVLKHDIKAVLSVIRTPLSDSSKVFGIKYFCVNAEDTSKEDLLSHFPETNRWITDCIESGRPVLVHCVAGVSRSATVVCAYLMHRHKLSADEAIERVRQKRPIIKPNKGFFRQLQLYHHLTYTLDPMNTRLQKYLLDYWNWKSEREMQLFRLNKWKVHYNPLS